MGWTFYDIATLPEPGDIVWCKWPLRESRGRPGPVARPTLVREAFVRTDPAAAVTYGSLIISYGTGKFDDTHRAVDLVISEMRRARELGLHKPTRFSLDPADRKHLLWCEEFFVAPAYLQRHGVVIGRLGEQELARMKECLARRQRETPTPPE